MAGEVSQDTGRDGLHEAKRWLDRTTRVHESWTHRDKPLSELLEFKWPHSDNTFSFDLGGKFRGSGLQDQAFLTEVKKYKNESNLPIHFRDFLAKCYVAFLSHPGRCDHFLWFAWSPFQAQAWDTHTSPDSVRRALLHKVNRERVLGSDDEAQAKAQIDAEAVVRVSERVWLLTFTDRQQDLVLTREHYLEVVKMITAEAV